MPGSAAMPTACPRPCSTCSKSACNSPSYRERPTKRLSVRGQPLQRRPAWPDPQHSVGDDRLAPPAHVDRADGLDARVAGYVAGRRLADENDARLGQLLEARGDVRGVANRGVVHRQVRADVADDDRAGVDPHADGQVDAVLLAESGALLVEAAADAQGRQDGATGVILVRDRRPEEGEEAVATEVVEGAAVPLNFAEGQLQELVKEGHEPLVAEPLGDADRVDDVAEEGGDLLALADRRQRLTRPICQRRRL